MGAGLSLERQVGLFPKGLGLAGVGAANLMAKGGTDFPNSPHSIGSGGRPALANDAYNPQIVNQRIEQNNTQYPDAVRQNTPQVQSRGTSQPIRPPEDGKLPAFPTAEQVKAKTSVQGEGDYALDGLIQKEISMSGIRNMGRLRNTTHAAIILENLIQKRVCKLNLLTLQDVHNVNGI